MADTTEKDPPKEKEKKKKKSNLKKSEPQRGSSEASPGPESRKPSLAPPTAQEEGRKKSLTPPTRAEGEGRKTSVAPPTVNEPEERKPSLTSSTTTDQEDRKSLLAPPTGVPANHEPQRTGSLKEDRSRQRSSIRKASTVLQDLDEAKLLELKEAFKLFDMDQDGFISGIDLKQTFGTLGRTDVTDEEIKHMLSEAANPLDFDAFVMLLGFKTISLDPEEILLEALGKWDKDQSGFIQEEMIRHDLMTWGDKFTEKEVDVALEDAPVFVNNGKHMIDYVRFCKMLCGLRKKTRDVTVDDFLM